MLAIGYKFIVYRLKSIVARCLDCNDQNHIKDIIILLMYEYIDGVRENSIGAISPKFETCRNEITPKYNG